MFQEFLREIEKLKNEMSEERKIWREESVKGRKEDRMEREGRMENGKNAAAEKNEGDGGKRREEGERK